MSNNGSIENRTSTAGVVTETTQSGVAQTSGLLRLTTKHTLLVLGVMAGVLGLSLLYVDEQNRVPFLLMAVSLGGMIWLRSGWSLICFFLILFTLKFVAPMGQAPYVRNNFGVFHPSDFLYVFLVMSFVGVSLRYIEVNKYDLGFFSKFGWSRTIKPAGSGEPSRLTVGSTNRSEQAIRQPATVKRGNKNLRFPSLFGGRWWLIPGAILLAYTLLGVFPEDESAIRRYWIKPRPMRLIFMFGALFLIWFTVRGLFTLVMRWKMGPDQAGVQVRSMYAKEFWREHRGLEARRAKMILKKLP